MSTKQEMLTKIAELQKQIEAMPDDQLTGRVLNNSTHQDNVFLTCVDGGASRLNITSRYVDCVKQGRVFHDRQSAQNFARYEQLIQEMRVISSQHASCDWGNVNQDKYMLAFSNCTNKWCEEFIFEYKNVGVIHCSTSGALLEWVNSLSASDQEILKWGEL